MNRRGVRFIILAGVVALHLVLILTITISTGQKERRADTTIFKVVDLQEYVPPPPEPEKEEKPVIPEEKIEVAPQDSIAEEIIETEKEVVEVNTGGVSSLPEIETPPQIEYLPQHKISVPPAMPSEEIRKRIKYPPLANRQKIEAVVFLELYIDKYGEIRNIVVLKDPGYGFAEAAVDALQGMTVVPAEANGTPVAVRYRYPIRFKLK